MERVVRAMPATVYLAPTARRRYLTRRAAIRAEARALIARKYPTEEDEYDDMGRCTYGGFHWTQMPRADELFKRVCRMLERYSSN